MLLGNSRERSNGPITLVEIFVMAEVMRSDSPKVVIMAGIEVANMLSTSSGPTCGAGELSLSKEGLPDRPDSWGNPMGLLVKIAVRSRRSKSCMNVSIGNKNKISKHIHRVPFSFVDPRQSSYFPSLPLE